MYAVVQAVFPLAWVISTGAIGGNGAFDMMKSSVVDGFDTAVVWTLSRAFTRQYQVPGATDWVQLVADCHDDW